ncbi:MAG: murein biosynthesis integral membrane protein MurJ, partial [Blastocatellia bacterium]
MSQPEVSTTRTTSKRSGTAVPAFLVATGILLSRITGLFRESVFAHYFGNSGAADAYKAAFRIPNFLQTLFGEGVLSASFIPVYASLIARGDEREARRVAGAIFTLLFFFTSLLVLTGVLTAPFLIDAIAPGFTGPRRELTIQLVRIFFPGIGLLVLSAWCLGILNSHRQFFISYAAPVAMNIAIIATLIAFGRHRTPEALAATVAWGAVVGSALQIGVQMPSVLRLLRGLPLVFNYALENVRTVVKNFVPVFISRGVVQVSAYVDQLLASLLPIGAVAALGYAQLLALLPVSLFGMSVSAAELPAMSSVLGEEDEIADKLRQRLNLGLRQIAYFVVPSAMAFLTLGDVVSGGIFQSGIFTHKDSLYVWGILAGSSVGLLAMTMGRLYSSTYYALRDTKTPLRFAVIRVALTSILGYL